MKKHQNNFNVAFPQSVNADHQMAEVIHREIDPMGSYTGRQLMEDILDERDAIPVQDADDL